MVRLLGESGPIYRRGRINLDRRGAPPAFTPASLFAASEPGGWANVSASRCWTDTGRTTQVAIAGDPVRAWQLDGASGPIYATLATAGTPPTFQIDANGVPYLDCSGASDGLSFALNLSAVNQATVIAAVQKDSDAATQVIVEHTPATFSNAGAFYLIAREQANALYTALGKGTAAISAAQLSSSGIVGAAPDRAVLTALYSIATDTNTLRRNGTAFTTATGVQGGGNYANSTFFIGARNSNTLRFDGRIYGLIVRGAMTSGTQLTDAEAWADRLLNP